MIAAPNFNYLILDHLNAEAQYNQVVKTMYELYV